MLSFTGTLDLARLLLSSAPTRVERSFRFAVVLTSGVPTSVVADVLAEGCSSGRNESTSVDEEGFVLSTGSFGGVARGLFGTGELGIGELRFTFDRRCVDQSPCMDLFRVFDPCVNVQHTNATAASARTDISILLYPESNSALALRNFCLEVVQVTLAHQFSSVT